MTGRPRTEPAGAGPRPNRAGRAAFLCLALLGAGCAAPSSPTMTTVPREWRRTNPWGPEAWAARREARLKPIYYTEQMAAWAELGRRTIQEGDILFRYGASYKPYDNFTSRVISGIQDDRFSHDGIAHWEGDALCVYDAEPEPQGVRKIPFEFWMLDTAKESLVVKRPRPEFRGAIPAAEAYCEDAWLRQVPFDPDLGPGDDKLYCEELIEKAYRAGGVVLSEPVMIRCLPHYKRWLPIYPLLVTLTKIRVDMPVFAMGNACYGTYGSPLLETVYEQSPDPHEGRRRGPTCGECEPPAQAVSP